MDAVDSDCYAIENESHWAVGWVETLLVDPSNAAAIALAEEIRSSLEDYPVLDDSHFSETEFNEYLESWDSWARRDYVRGLIAELDSREFHQCAALVAELPADVIDEMVEHARQYVNWEYCGEEINIAGLIQSTRDCDIVAVLLSLIDVDAPVITLDTIETREVSE